MELERDFEGLNKAIIEKLNFIIDGTRVGTWEWNVQTGETVFNEFWANIIGYTLEELSPVSISTWINVAHPEDISHSNENLQRHFSGEFEYYEFEGRMKHKDGRWIWVLDRGKVAKWTEDGKPLLMYGTHQDITRRKLAEEALKKSEAELRELNATKDKFFSIIAHDLKNPVNAIAGFSSMINERILINDFEGVRKFAAIINESTHRISDLLHTLLDWSRSQSGSIRFNTEEVDIVNLIFDTTELFRASAYQKSIEISVDHPASIKVQADKSMVETIIRNLVSNAIKFTFPGGRILVSVQQTETEVLIRVSDNGVGIDSCNIDKLFKIEENYFTRGTQNEYGTGLGLILCKEFVGKHGGKIWVESEVGVGSSFVFTLPQLIHP